jgi:propanediol dehydratase small subunit
MTTHALSGRPLEEITLERAVAGDLTPDDLRIHPDTLRHQAQVAEDGGNPQLAANLRRAVELTGVADDELIRIYEALRPARSTRDELEAVAALLERGGAPSCAAFVREAAEVYERRGLLRHGGAPAARTPGA